jgi:uncharacterized cupin superfamily protein
MITLKSPALDPATVKSFVSYDAYYPKPFNLPCQGRQWRELGAAVGLTQFGVNLTRLAPGAWSSQRHWHLTQDEFVYILEGEVVLLTDTGEQVLTSGMAAGFRAGVRDGHHLVNRSDRPAILIEVGTRSATDEGEYSDIDMKFEIRDGIERYLHKNGTPY